DESLSGDHAAWNAAGRRAAVLDADVCEGYAHAGRRAEAEHAATLAVERDLAAAVDLRIARETMRLGELDDARAREGNASTCLQRFGEIHARITGPHVLAARGHDGVRMRLARSEREEQQQQSHESG